MEWLVMWVKLMGEVSSMAGPVGNNIIASILALIGAVCPRRQDRMHRSKTSSGGFTILEILLLLLLLAILASLFLPSMPAGPARNQFIRTLSNMKQIQLATRQMAVDNAETGNPVQWTCSNSTPLTLDQWKKLLSPEYLSAVDFNKLLTVTCDGRFSGTKTISDGFNVFAVTALDPDDTLLFATKNWHGPMEKGLSGDPYGTKAFVIFTKGNSGMVLQAKQTTNLSVVAGGGMHNFLPLK